MPDARVNNSGPGRLVPSGAASRGTMVGILLVLLFGAFLLWSTLSSQKVECTVAIEFNGARGTATASAQAEADAMREAQTTACGPLSQGMDDRIACTRIPPLRSTCRRL
jgi:hypothetical protein